MKNVVVIDDARNFLDQIRLNLTEHNLVTTDFRSPDLLALTSQIESADLIFLDHSLNACHPSMGYCLDGDVIYSWICDIIGTERASAIVIGISSGKQPYLRHQLDYPGQCLCHPGVNRFVEDPSKFPQFFR